MVGSAACVETSECVVTFADMGQVVWKDASGEQGMSLCAFRVLPKRNCSASPATCTSRFHSQVTFTLEASVVPMERSSPTYVERISDTT